MAPPLAGGVVPARAGIGLRSPHFDAILDQQPDVGWIEVHSENYFGDGGPALAALGAARAIYPVSLHGVGLSLGGTDPLDEHHLDRLARLVARIEPGLVSDHLCWTGIGGVHTHDLLPLPYTEESLVHVAARIAKVQDRLGRRILVENLSGYVAFEASEIPEWEFLAAVAARAGCGILLDVNNVHVSASNLDFDAGEYVDAIPAESVAEIHLAGHATRHHAEGTILIDDHAARVPAPVWALYERVVGRIGPVPTLIEWDADLPVLDVLVDEARTAEGFLEPTRARVA